MSKKSKSGKPEYISTNQTVAENRRARFDYHLEETFEAGISLTGTEVKSLRLGLCSINEAHAFERGNEIWITNLYIPEYTQAGAHLQHEPRRQRRLLLHRKQIHRLMGAVTREGYTIIPVRLYFDANGRAKMEIALAKGKKLHDKRETEKERDWNRQRHRLMRAKE